MLGWCARPKAYGLHFVISVNRLNVLTSRLYSLFTERLTLRLSEFRGLSGYCWGTTWRILMRFRAGVMSKLAAPRLEFQIGYVRRRVRRPGATERRGPQIRVLGQQMNERGRSAWSGNEPLRIDALPKSSSYRQVMAEVFGMSQEEYFFLRVESRHWPKMGHYGSAEHADWLRGILGITSGNRKRTLQTFGQRQMACMA